MSKVQLHKIEKNRYEHIIEFLVALGAFSQVFIGIILIYQLHAYRDSNSILQSTLESSHVPWLTLNINGIELKGASPEYPSEHMEIAYVIKNNTTEPAYHFQCKWNFKTSDGPPQLEFKYSNRQEVKNDCIMPNESRPFLLECGPLSSTSDGTVIRPGVIMDQIKGGIIKCQAFISYTDPLTGKTFGMEYDQKMSGPNALDLLDLELSGDFPGMKK
jgi:hypothetical protein